MIDDAISIELLDQAKNLRETTGEEMHHLSRVPGNSKSSDFELRRFCHATLEAREIHGVRKLRFQCTCAQRIFVGLRW